MAAGREKAYPLDTLGTAVVDDTVNGEPVVVFSREQGPTGTAFSPKIPGRLLTFEMHEGQIRDLETSTRWDISGRAVEGPLQGEQLQPLPTRRAFWFAVSLAAPDIPVYLPE